MPVLKNPRWEAYAQLIAQGIEAKEAWGRLSPNIKNNASFSASLSRMKKQPQVIARIEELVKSNDDIRIQETAAVYRKVVLSREWVIDQLVENVNRCMKNVKVLGSRGAPTGVYKFDSQGATRALELLGREIGMFIDRKQVDINAEFRSMTDADLRRIIQENQDVFGMKLIEAQPEPAPADGPLPEKLN